MNPPAIAIGEHWISKTHWGQWTVRQRSACRRSQRRNVGWALGCVLGLLIARAGPARAHELSFDELRLRPQRSQPRSPSARFDAGTPLSVHRLHAELVLRAEHDAGQPSQRAARLLAKAESGVELMARQASGTWVQLEASWRVRELWQPGGAVAGDLLVSQCALPPAATALRVVLHPPLADVAVLVTAPTGERAGQIDGVWLHEGASPPYLLSADGLNPQWNEASEVLVAQQTPTRPEPASPTRSDSWQQTGYRFFRLGIQHVVPDGPDHAVFVALLALGHLNNFRQLILEISLFTLAHLMALIALRQDWVATPGPWIEPAIALSILLMALDCFRRAGNGRVGNRWRRPVIAGFGLWHGLGFAGSLATLPLARGQELPALAAFNVGVELGQLSVALTLWLLAQPLIRSDVKRARSVRALSLVAGAVALWWLVERAIRAASAA